MKIWFTIILLLLAGVAHAADRITALVTITNAVGTTNGQTFTVNASVRTFTNSVVVPGSQVLTNVTEIGSKTNLFRQLGSYPVTSVTLVDNETNSFKLIGASGTILTVAASAGYATVSYSTQTVASMTGVRVPISGEPTAGLQNYIASELVVGLNAKATNALYESSIVVSNLVGRTNTQTISGDKTFTGTVIMDGGSITNLRSLHTSLTNTSFSLRVGDNRITITSNSATLTAVSGGLFVTGGGTSLLDTNSVTRLFFDDDDFVINGTNGSYALIVNPDRSLLAYTNFISGGTFYGNGAGLSNVVGVTQVTNLNVTGTNNFPVNSDLSFARFPVTSLANGNNAAVPVGTNVFIEVSGPSAAFTINGINCVNAQRDGKMIVIVNQTGFDMTIAHQSGTDPAAANRIVSMTGADRTTTGNGTATLIYSGSASRWILTNFDP